MYCINCGTQLPDDASFCLKCGKPQKAGTQAQAQEPQWETCEIVWDHVDDDSAVEGATIRFRAEATGPNGTYTADKTGRLYGASPDASREQQRAALQAFRQVLFATGWDPAGKGTAWYNYKFQRRVR